MKNNFKRQCRFCYYYQSTDYETGRCMIVADKLTLGEDKLPLTPACNDYIDSIPAHIDFIDGIRRLTQDN